MEPQKSGLAGATEKARVETEVKGKIVELAWWMKKNGYAESTIKVSMSVLKALRKLGADLMNPESVKGTIAKAVCLKGKVGKPWSESRRHIAIATYTLFLKMQGERWDPPFCHVTRKLPFIPREQELDALIAGCGRKTATLLQLLKETAMRVGEARSLLWTDIDFERRIITLNTPEKHGNPRIFKVSVKLVNMLAALPRVYERVFPATRSSVKTRFFRSRKRLATKLQNPRLLKITYHTFRHWKATMLYHQTHDPLYVKEFLGHKKLDTTLLYIQIEKTLYRDDSDEFTVKVARDPEEIKALLEVGFQYICEKDGLLYFRKRK